MSKNHIGLKWWSNDPRKRLADHLRLTAEQNKPLISWWVGDGWSMLGATLSPQGHQVFDSQLLHEDFEQGGDQGSACGASIGRDSFWRGIRLQKNTHGTTIANFKVMDRVFFNNFNIQIVRVVGLPNFDIYTFAGHQVYNKMGFDMTWLSKLWFAAKPLRTSTSNHIKDQKHSETSKLAIINHRYFPSIKPTV